MIFNPVIVKNGTKLPALTNPGTAADLLAPKQLIDAEGNALTGTIPAKSATDLTVSGATVSVPAGYYAANASKSVATATQATPSITVSSTGLITASATQTAGYVSAGTKSATRQLTTKAAATITPGTANQTIASGTYLTGAQTIKGDANLLAANIKSGVSIFGVAGTYAENAYVVTQTYSTETDADITFTGLPFAPTYAIVAQENSLNASQRSPDTIYVTLGLLRHSSSTDVQLGQLRFYCDVTNTSNQLSTGSYGVTIDDAFTGTTVHINGTGKSAAVLKGTYYFVFLP